VIKVHASTREFDALGFNYGHCFSARRSERGFPEVFGSFGNRIRQGGRRRERLADAAMRELLREGESANTQTSYRSALRYWAAWLAPRYRQPLALPVAPATVLQFIVDHVQRTSDNTLLHELPIAIDEALVSQGFKGKLGPLALSTVGHRLAVLSKLHGLHRLPNPCHDEGVRDLVAKTRRAYAKRGAPTARKAALTREPLDALLATCDGSLRGVRDRALLLFAWASGGRRRTEVVNASLDNTHRVGERAWVYTLRHDKSNQAGADWPENDKPIVGVAADALEAWLAASGLRSGAIFLRIRKGATLGEPLTPSAVRRIVLERCQMAGLEGNSTYSLLYESFRVVSVSMGEGLGLAAISEARASACVSIYSRMFVTLPF
jgi:integrase